MSLPVLQNEGVLTGSLSEFNAYPLVALRKLIKGKLSCLILNPGDIARELVKDEKFKRKFTADFWRQGSGYDLEKVLKSNDFLTNQFQYTVILVDPSGCNKFTDKELEMLNEMRLLGKSVYSVTSFFEHITGKIPLIQLKDHWVMNNELFFVNRPTQYHIYKRVFDILFCLILLPPALLLLIPSSLITLLTSKGPLLFSQKRVGKNGKPFTLYKIRTMVHNPNGHTAHTVKNDDRVTLVGKVLRRTKIDELPQLYNILAGEMSLIGPRPEKVNIVEELVKQNPYYHLRHTIVPGVSGWAQVNNPTATPEQNFEKLEYDLYYVKNMSIFMDLRILLHTIRVVLTLNSL